VAAGPTKQCPRISRSTASLALDYLSAANGTELRAEARVIKRGKRLVRCEVDVRDEAGTLVVEVV